jgi:probable HAF family extracellular repeat protein
MRTSKSAERFVFLAVVLLAVVITPPILRADGNPTYTVTDLGTLGGTVSRPKAINNLGQVVGFAYTAGDTSYRAFSYNGSSMSDLGTLGGGNSFAMDINDAGAIVGASDMPYFPPDPWARLDDYGARAFLYDGSTMSHVGDLGGPFSTATSINNAGQIAGYSDVYPNSPRHAFRKTGAQMIDLGTFGAGTTADGMNSLGQVVGRSFQGTSPTTNYQAFLYSNGSLQNLGTLGGENSWAVDINSAGTVVGSAWTSGSLDHPFVWQTGTMSDLGTLGGPRGGACAINTGGDIVGLAETENAAACHAFLYKGGVMRDLNALIPTGSGWMLWGAEDINDQGWIVGTGYNPSGRVHAFLLKPVPEPATLLLLMLGGLAVLRRR